jgi:sugar lactone lactonase YvrE
MVLALVLLLLLVCGTQALADSTEDSSLIPTGVDSLQEYAQLMGPETQSTGFGSQPDTEAAELLPHSDLDREQAAELLQGVYGQELEAPAEFFDELEIEAFRSDFDAVVDPPVQGAPLGLLSSTLPLRAEDESGEKRIVDLDLEAAGGEIHPQNPLIEASIPSILSDGISFPDVGVQVEFGSGSLERAASKISESSVFYPNVRNETDVVIGAIPTGIEIFTHIRSAEAPRQQMFSLDAPDGTQLVPDGSGGGEVVDPEGETVLSVPPPWAIDAEGTSVPVELSIEKQSILVSVDPPADAVYPILLDPVFEVYNFTGATGPGVAGQEWTGASNPGFGYQFDDDRPGMTVEAFGGAATSPGNQASYNYFVPRYWSDQQAGYSKPSSYIRNMKLWYLTFMAPFESGIPAQNRSAYPFMQLSLWDENRWEWVWQGSRMGNEGNFTDLNHVFDMSNPNDNPGVKHGGLSIATFGYSNAFPRYVNVQQASVEVTDKDLPVLGYAVGPSGWMHETAKAPLEYGASDLGLGVYWLRLTQPSATGGSQTLTTSNQCVGTARIPCPRTTNNNVRPISYEPKTMAQGENVVTVVAIDPVSNQSVGQPAKVKVDHTQPRLDLSGDLTQQGSVGTKLPSYTLNYSTSDGDDAAVVALTPIGTPGIGQGQLERPQGLAVDAAGNIWVTDRINNRVTAYSSSGSFVRQFGSAGTGDGQIKEPRGITIMPSGNILVAENGNKRIQQFTPQGAFVSKITNAAFVEPYGVEVGPNGVIWVTDSGAGKIFQFNPDGTLLRSQEIAKLREKFPGLVGQDGWGFDIDAFGNAWIAVHGGHHVIQLTPSLNAGFSFGGAGTGPGQMNNPSDVTVANSGNLLVTDDGNSRIQVFKPDGTFLRQFGTAGSDTGQLKEPRQADLGPDDRLYVVDAGNRRIARWDHPDQDPQSGVASIRIKVDGVTARVQTPGCATKNCSIVNSWTMNADNFSAGPHKVDFIATDGVGLTTTKTLNVETHGDLQAPAVALSGSMTEQATLGTTRPSYKLKVVATDPGSVEERQSGVASTTIKVDGAIVDSTSPGCPTGGCSVTREWTLNSNSYAVGTHFAEVIATDAAGRASLKFVEFKIARDTTAPVFASLDPFYGTPEGWVEQRVYGVLANVTDAGGYGVTSVQLKIDGVVVRGVSQACAAGGCSTTLGLKQPLDTTAYSGGSHPAELIATDGAGNSRKRSWTLNVDPLGHISATEAIDTVEAVEVTAPQSYENSPVGGLVTEEVGEEGSNPQLVEEGEQLVSVGAPTPSEIALDPENGFSVETVGASAAGTTATSTIGVEPVSLSPNAGTPQITDGSAAVVANSANGVDTVLRPAYDGLMAFQDIRDPTGPQEYSWKVRVEEDETLKSIDATHAALFWDDGTQGLLITAQSAHDADGKAVATSLAVSGDVVTLIVHHKVSGVIYPVVAGIGYEGGFQQIRGVMPPPTEQTPAELEAMVFYELQAGAPELVPTSEAEAGASASSASQERRRQFVRSVCGHSAEWVEGWGGGKAIAEGKVEAHCGNGFDPANQPGQAVLWRGSMRGAYLYTPGVRVRHRGAIACVKGTPGKSKIRFYAMKDAYECHFGPKTSDENGGVSAGAGHYLRAQAHWELGERGKCWANQPSEECTPPDTNWMWQDRAIELHLWPSGNIDKVDLQVYGPKP